MVRDHGQRFAGIGQELAAGSVEADEWPRRIEWPLVDIKHILQVPDELGVGVGRDAPLLL
jgi:hypothetical protein